MEKIATLLLLLISPFFGNCQQDYMVSQYMFNEIVLNPAYSGSHEFTNISALYRKQWQGFVGAPTTAFFTYDAPIKSINSGYGFLLSNDNIGVSQQTDLMVNYSYHLPLNKSKLSFGIQAGMTFYKANLTELIYWDQDDKVYEENIGLRAHPNFGFGLYYYASNKYFIGLSSPRILEYNTRNLLSITQKEVLNLERHYYLHAGKVLNSRYGITYKPSLLLKYFPGLPIQADLNFNTYFGESVGIGVSYRTQESFVILLEMRTKRNLNCAIAYDLPTGLLANYHSGSFEIMLSYDIMNNKKGIKNPRFF